VLYESKKLIDELVDSTDYDIAKPYEIRACEGVIPTGQNHANIQHDMEALVAQMAAAGREEAEISLYAQMLVRAYDPCISCSVH